MTTPNTDNQLGDSSGRMQRLVGFDSECRKEYRWRTEESHYDNSETMNAFINDIMPDDWSITLLDGTYAEVQLPGGNMVSLDAGGDGDSYNHLVVATII